MFYREAGEFKTTYAADHATFPIAFEVTLTMATGPSRSSLIAAVDNWVVF